LKTKTAQEIVETQVKFITFDVDPMIIFAPVIEIPHLGAFIDEEPEKIVMSGKANDVPWMTGVTAEEGVLRSGFAYNRFKHTLKEFEDKFNEKARDLLMIYEDPNLEMKAKLIKQFYFGHNSFEEQQSKMTDLVGDVMFSYPMQKAITVQHKYNKSPIYQYLFGYRGICSLALMVDGPHNKNDVCHGDDLVYLFPILCPVQKPPTDLEMIDVMTSLWTNFAKYRNPTPKNWTKTKWYPVATSNNEYLEIKGPEALEMTSNMFTFRMGFWQGIDMFKTAKREEL